MKTLDEAIVAALEVGTLDRPPTEAESARVMRLQNEYMAEVYQHPIIDVAALTWIQTTARLMAGVEVSIDQLLKNAFKNGISLGIVIGIQMERNDLPLTQEQPGGEQS
jgi:hypothetical protein